MASTFGIDGSSLFDFVVHDGNGVKGLVDLGVTRVPDRYVQPPTERIERSEASAHLILPIDLSKLDGPDHAAAASEIVRAAETLGFFQVVNHGVAAEVLEELKKAAFRFSGQPPEKKAMHKKGESPSPNVKYGTSFVPEKEKALEWKDYISMVYSTDDDALAYWPQPSKEVVLEYLKTSMNMVRKILRILISNLKLTVDDSEINALIKMKMANMNFYLACPNPDLTVGVGRHSDMGTLTVLLQDGIGGLYVKVEEDMNIAGKKGEWTEIPRTPGALVINVGDTLQYISAEHRVSTTSTQSRVSVPIFTAPKPTQKIGPLPEVIHKDGVARYRDVVFGDYMTNFFGNPHEGNKSLDFAKITDDH